MPSDFQRLIIKEFERNELLYSDFLGETLEEYAKLLVSENKKYNLTRITTPEDIINKHFVDSILGFEKFIENESLKNSFHIMDVGSGAGFPGIPLLLYDQICKDNQLINKIDLLDSNRKKTEFLHLMKPKIARRIGKDLIEIHNSRLEKLALGTAPPDLYISRATGKIRDVLNFLEKFVKKNFDDVIPKDGQIYLLYYGGPDSIVLPDKKGRPFELSYNAICRLHRQARNVYRYQFSSSNYSRKNVLYVITSDLVIVD